jgi:enoyl-CoA hydratase
MEGSTVRVEKLGAVTVVTLDRPEVRNAVDSATARALYDAFVAFDEDTEASVAVFHGANGHFCAGWDLQFGAQLAAQGVDALAELEFEPCA